MPTPIPPNQCAFTAQEIIQATDAAYHGSAGLRSLGVSIDSRTIETGALFVALRGIRDGHDFLRVAAERGAAAAIVERGRPDRTIACFEVDEPLAALGQVANLHLSRIRDGRPLPVIAIGGAAGKTTTKELTAALARALFGEILAAPGNLNNLIGVPMTILTLDENDRAAVIECGTNRLGEIRRLNAIVQPDVTLVLNVDIEHTEGLGSLENIADEEAALFKSARVAVFPAADRMLAARIPTGTDMITFGDGTSADVRLTGREMIATGGQRIALELAPSMVQNGVEPKLDVLLNLPGRACANNAAAAVAATAAAWRCPLGREELAAMARALASVRPVEGRLCTRQINGIVVIDDTYNANPSSVRAALAVAREMADGLHARLIVALGDMLELGALSAEAHAEVLRATFNARPDAFVAVGLATADAVKIVDGRGSGRPAVVVTAADSDEAGRILRPMVRPGDVLLLKGSRGIAMERVAAALA